MTEAADRKPLLLVLASTYPRWKDDPEPGFVHELSRRLTATFDVVVVCPHARGAKRRETFDGVEVVRYRYAPDALETLVNDGGVVTNLRRARWKWLLVPGFVVAQWWAASRALRRRRPAAVHAHWLVPQGAVAAAIGGARVPFVVTSHGADLFALRGPVPTAIKRWVVRRARAMTVVSEAMLGEARSLGAADGAVRVRPMSVDLDERFTPDARVERSPDEILFVGRLVEKKGLRHLIAAMPAIRAARPTAFLTVAGFGPEEEACRRLVAALDLGDAVRFLGAVRQPDLPALYRRAALLVAPFVRAGSGDQEGLGLVMVEALGCACPVLAGDVPAVRDLPVPTVAAEDTNALAGNVLALLSADPDARAQRTAVQREQVLARFGWSAATSDYAAILSAAARGEP
ncbi:glycosyltransferase [Tahibacter soli]|uniref:Glycosyltransferase n=1 Tax=Tahibacter soli TaxID=2983605 RepID=A0A9X3YRS8_9GAMM|nr:glycosyltransferase [Tahibacter soli]MDC8015833.1 glycosyltransferase [Tahibacter soli]